MTHFAYERVRAGKPMPGVFEVNRTAPMRTIIEDLLILFGASQSGEWEGQVNYIPFQ